MNVADGFVTNFHKHPSMKYDAAAFVSNTSTTPSNKPAKNSESRVPNYPPTFVFFRDYRVPKTRKPVLLPVELLEDDDKVILQIHHRSVDDYVTLD